jgi:hypothetical protein
MSLPEKVFGILHTKHVFDKDGNSGLAPNIEELFRYKDKNALEKALSNAYIELVNNGCGNVHGFMINSEWFTFGGYTDGYMGVKEIDKKRNHYPIHWSVGDETYAEYLKEGVWYRFPDNRPSAAVNREYPNTSIPIFYFLGLPVWLFDIGITEEQIAIAVPC